ncbi:MAG: Mur ligase family protein, partial [Myxococcota bacterium]|nr:Mur ligase family protein [Myxococcota bacterium]
MDLQDSRRLTGLNLLSPRAGAVAEVRFEEGEAPEAALEAWSTALDRALKALDWPTTGRQVRRWSGGASLLLDAPLDALYAATEINEWAIAEANGEAPPLAETLGELQRSIAEETNPGLMALESVAHERGVPFVWDDDQVCIGMGRHSRTWATDRLPGPDAVPWETLRSIPVAYITGTNGKTTSTRMTTRILQAAGMSPGCTSSDGVVVKGEEVERGDWTGPGAARRVLRDTQVDAAVLETARGGILRRGLVIDTCDAALITNVANDHLGDYGVFSVEDMARVKGLVCQAVSPNGRRVLNADDPLLRSLGRQPGAPVCWFSVEPITPWIQAHLEDGGEAWLLQDGWLVFHDGQDRTPVVKAEELPSTFGGTARHNIANALGASALSHALGVELHHIREG